MSYTFLMDSEKCISSPAVVVESSAECFSDIPASVLSRLNLTAEKSYCNGSETESCHGSQYGTMPQHSEVQNGAGLSMSSESVPHAKGLAHRETCSGLMMDGAPWSSMLFESVARLDPESFSWRTRQGSLFEQRGELLENWPAWAMTRGPELLALTMPDWITVANDFGWLRTPCANDGAKWYVSGFTATERRDAGRQPMLIHQLIEYHGLSKGWANPEFWELMMEWPIGWTDLKPLETAKFHQWLSSHGKH